MPLSNKPLTFLLNKAFLLKIHGSPYIKLKINKKFNDILTVLNIHLYKQINLTTLPPIENNIFQPYILSFYTSLFNPN